MQLVGVLDSESTSGQSNRRDAEFLQDLNWRGSSVQPAVTNFDLSQQ